MYSVQVNAYGNYLVCKGQEVRNSYRMVKVFDSYAQALAFKVAHSC